MLTNNGRIILRALLWRYPFGSNSENFNQWSKVSPKLKDYAGKSPMISFNTVPLSNLPDSRYICSTLDITKFDAPKASEAAGADYLTICLGQNNNPESPNDYTLIPCSSTLVGSNYNMDDYSTLGFYVGSIIATNTGTENEIVKEVGLVLKKTSSTADYQNNYLLARKVLPEPVTIAPGESYTFTLILQ